MNAISEFLYGILAGINGIVGNYGVAIIIFTFLMRMICMPFDYKSRVGMRKMSLIQPKLNEIQRKYANDKTKMQQKQAELMKKEGYNPMSGCLPMLLTWPLMIAMFSAMRLIANEQLVMQTFRFLVGDENPIQLDEAFLWVKNIWMTDSPFAAAVPDLNSLKMVPRDAWVKVYEMVQQDEQFFSALQTVMTNNGLVLDFSTDAALSTSLTNLMKVLGNNEAYVAAAATVPGWANLNFLLFNVSIFQNYNGLLILPILAGVTQVLQTRFMNSQQPQQPAQNGQGTGNFMKWFFPMLSVYFCLSSNAGFALYWVVSSVVSSVQSIVINKILEKKDGEKTNKKVAGEGSVK
ncbi:MAG: YidC/Oxa1 family membrane protein insertase [Clostridia bacterium]|nr:YidC/Oxa1 family membrane protein insertase [Clostridia bacterium]